MSEPPEPNLDGSYTLSKEAIQEIRDAFLNLARANNDAETIAALDKAYDLLPMPAREKQKLEAFEANIQKQMHEYEKANLTPTPRSEFAKVLQERQEKETQLLAQSHKDELKGLFSHDDYFDIKDRQGKEQQRLKTQHEKEGATPSTTISPELLKALQERHERQTAELNKRQLAERKNCSPARIPDLTNRHSKEIRDHEERYKKDLIRHAQQEQDAKKLLKEAEERTKSYEPDHQQKRRI